MTVIIAIIVSVTSFLIAYCISRQGIVERNRVLEVLRESEERTRTILNTAVNGIVTINEERTILSVNIAVEKIFGYREEELLGKNIHILMPEPFHSEHDSYILNYLRTGHTNVIGVGREVRGKRKDGSVFPLDLSVSESFVTGQRLFTGILSDISERKQTEDNLRNAYQLISSDLEAAAAIQKELLPCPSTIAGINFEWLFCPSSFVAGDILNYFQISAGRVGFYLLDVSGHGVPAAMLSVSLSWVLSNMLNGNDGDDSDDYSRHQMISPAKVLGSLNTIFQENRTAGQYITMIYGVIDCDNNQLTISQAGLPAPVFCNPSGASAIIGSGGFPVGLVADVNYEEETIEFHPGDRFFIYSDGVTECFDINSCQFSDQRLVGLIESGAGEPLDNLLKNIENELHLWRGKKQFDDDVTLLAIERERA